MNWLRELRALFRRHRHHFVLDAVLPAARHEWPDYGQSKARYVCTQCPRYHFVRAHRHWKPAPPRPPAPKAPPAPGVTIKTVNVRFVSPHVRPKGSEHG